MTKTYHHTGMPTGEPQPGESYVEETKVWVTRPEDHPYRIEFLRFESDSPVAGPVRDQPHVAFRVDDIKAALEGEDVILAPFEALPGLTVAFIMKDGAVFEYMQFAPGKNEIGDCSP